MGRTKSKEISRTIYSPLTCSPPHQFIPPLLALPPIAIASPSRCRYHSAPFFSSQVVKDVDRGIAQTNFVVAGAYRRGLLRLRGAQPRAAAGARAWHSRSVESTAGRSQRRRSSCRHSNQCRRFACNIRQHALEQRRHQHGKSTKFEFIRRNFNIAADNRIALKHAIWRKRWIWQFAVRTRFRRRAADNFGRTG